MRHGETILQTNELRIGYPGSSHHKAPFAVGEDLSLYLSPGKLTCLLGPNGCGKSTLIRSLSGLQPPLNGTVKVDNTSIQTLNARERAKKISLVLTEREESGQMPVEALISLGRSPYTNWLGRLSESDKQMVNQAIRSTGIEHLLPKFMNQLSDGERQKVMITRALAQDTPLIILDEPTAHLDLPNRVEIMQLLKQLAHNTGKGILVSSHELDLALQTADTLWLMNQKQIIKGVPEDLVLDGTFEEVFAREGCCFDRTTGSFRIHNPESGPVSLEGDAVALFWTQRALEKANFKVAFNHTEAPVHVKVRDHQGLHWELTTGKGHFSGKSVKNLLHQLTSWKTENTTNYG